MIKWATEPSPNSTAAPAVKSEPEYLLMLQKNARLQWLIPTGKNNISPRGARFSTVAKFDQQGDNWTEDAWSLVVQPVAWPDDRGEQDVFVQFLSASAPHGFLLKGSKFELHEGAKVIAVGMMT
ncbi:MAG: hypothetical protein R3D51_17890 [Hyphomicrobiaceae bacterium]